MAVVQVLVSLTKYMIGIAPAARMASSFTLVHQSTSVGPLLRSGFVQGRADVEEGCALH